VALLLGSPALPPPAEARTTLTTDENNTIQVCAANQPEQQPTKRPCVATR
jgi:hypothetical protein